VSISYLYPAFVHLLRFGYPRALDASLDSYCSGNCSLLRMSCMSPGNGWGRAVLRTVAHKRFAPLPKAPRLAFSPHWSFHSLFILCPFPLGYDHVTTDIQRLGFMLTSVHHLNCRAPNLANFQISTPERNQSTSNISEHQLVQCLQSAKNQYSVSITIEQHEKQEKKNRRERKRGIK
jgi:hypothetical protein